ncbi:MAG: hypothetical protein CMD46_00190 [Gammaproteobacteria bacterium]|nr:hypothetical protein [Gammaproteobacteria bacterium]
MINLLTKSKTTFALILSSTILISCGGGGGGGSDPIPAIPTPAPTVSISVDLSEAYINDDVTVTWSSTNASSCSASGSWDGSKGTSGSEVKYFVTTGSKTFTVECSGTGGSNSASASVTIAYKPLQTSRYTRTDGTDMFVDKGTNNIFHMGLIPRYLTKKHSGYTYGTGAVFGPGHWGDAPISCRSADLNGDNHPDAVIGTTILFSGGDDATQYDVNNPEIRERVHFLVNNGDGSFSSGKNLIQDDDYFRVTSYKELHIGDLNGDGLDDISTESDSAGGIIRGNGILLLVSQPDGTYADETSKIEFARVDRQRDGYVQEQVLDANGGSVFFFDLNGDGFKDLFNTYSTQSNGGMPKVFLSEEGNKYAPWSRWSTNNKYNPELFNDSGIRAGDVADFDNDGDEDLIFQCYNRYCFGDPNEQYYAERHSNYDWDPVSVDSSNGFVLINEDGDLNMDNAIHFPKTPLVTNTKNDDMHVGDINGDGFIDIVSVYGKSDPYYVDRKIQILINKDGTSLVDETDSRMPTDLRDENSGHAEGLIMLVDYDGDGDLDIYDFQAGVREGKYQDKSADYPYGRNGEAIFINDGSGNFTYEQFNIGDVDELRTYSSEDEDTFRDDWVGEGMHNGLERLCPIDFGDDYGTGFIFAFSYENDEFNGNDLGTEYQSQFFGTVRKITDNDVEDNTLFKSLEHIQVTVESNNDGAGNVYVINGQQKRSLELKTGKSYKFVHPSGHPLSFSENEDGTHNSGTEFTTGVVKSSGETIISINNRTPSNLYYYCDQHSGMGGSITIN